MGAIRIMFNRLINCVNDKLTYIFKNTSLSQSCYKFSYVDGQFDSYGFYSEFDNLKFGGCVPFADIDKFVENLSSSSVVNHPDRSISSPVVFDLFHHQLNCVFDYVEHCYELGLEPGFDLTLPFRYYVPHRSIKVRLNLDSISYQFRYVLMGCLVSKAFGDSVLYVKYNYPKVSRVELVVNNSKFSDVKTGSKFSAFDEFVRTFFTLFESVIDRRSRGKYEHIFDRYVV